MAEDLSKKLYVSNIGGWKDKLSKKRLSNRKLEVKVIDRGIILPARYVSGTREGGVCDSEFNFVAGYFRTEPPKKTSKFSLWACVESAYIVDRKELVQLDEDVIFGGVLIDHFGHFIMECWNRLWYVIQNPNLNSKVLFVLLRDYKPWFDEFFKLMGIDKERIIYVKQPTQCRSVIVPDQSQYSFNSFTKEYLLPYQAIKARVTPSKSKKLYLTRTDFDEKYLAWTNSDVKNFPSRGVCFNEKYFEDFFVAHGFEAISMEKLSVEEQISLIMGADEIISMLGTLSNWVAFCRPTAKVITLNRTHSNSDVSFQFLVNEAFNIHNFYVIDISKDFMYKVHINSACMLGSTEYWKKFVMDYFGEQIDIDDDTLYLNEALEKYVDFWYRKYRDSKEIVTRSLKDMCNRIVTLEAQVAHNRPFITYQTHVDKFSWGDWVSENQFSNPLDQKRDIHAIKIDFS